MARSGKRLLFPYHIDFIVILFFGVVICLWGGSCSACDVLPVCGWGLWSAGSSDWCVVSRVHVISCRGEFRWNASMDACTTS